MQHGGATRSSISQWSTSSSHVLVERQESWTPASTAPWRRKAGEPSRPPRPRHSNRGQAAKAEASATAAAQAWASTRRSAAGHHSNRSYAAKAKACARDADQDWGCPRRPATAALHGNRDRGRAGSKDCGTATGGKRAGCRANQYKSQASGSRDAQVQGQARGHKLGGKRVGRRAHQHKSQASGSRDAQVQGQDRGRKPRKLEPKEDRPEQAHGTRAKSKPAPTGERRVALKLAAFLLQLSRRATDEDDSFGSEDGQPATTRARSPKESKPELDALESDGYSSSYYSESESEPGLQVAPKAALHPSKEAEQEVSAPAADEQVSECESFSLSVTESDSEGTFCSAESCPCWEGPSSPDPDHKAGVDSADL